MAFLTELPLQLDALVAEVAAPECGGIATFLGLVRNHQEAVCYELAVEGEK